MATADEILAASRTITTIEQQFHGLADPQLRRGLNAVQQALSQHLPAREAEPGHRIGRPRLAHR